MSCAKNWRAGRLAAALACSTTILLAGCAGSGNGVSEIVRRELPVAPGYLAPVVVSEPMGKVAAELVIARERAGRLKANRIIAKVRAQWDRLRATYRRAR
jgi:hypothetical protein